MINEWIDISVSLHTGMVQVLLPTLSYVRPEEKLTYEKADKTQ